MKHFDSWVSPVLSQMTFHVSFKYAPKSRPFYLITVCEGTFTESGIGMFRVEALPEEDRPPTPSEKIVLHIFGWHCNKLIFSTLGRSDSGLYIRVGSKIVYSEQGGRAVGSSLGS